MVTSEDMAILRRITELALAGGWDSVASKGIDRLKAYFFLIDPEFWKALGKSLGWNIQEKQYTDTSKSTSTSEYITDGWLFQQHALTDHLAEGGDVTSFFEELLARQVIKKVIKKKKK